MAEQSPESVMTLAARLGILRGRLDYLQINTSEAYDAILLCLIRAHPFPFHDAPSAQIEGYAKGLAEWAKALFRARDDAFLLEEIVRLQREAEEVSKALDTARTGKTFGLTSDPSLVAAALLRRFGGTVEVSMDEVKTVTKETSGITVHPKPDGSGYTVAVLEDGS